MRAQYVKYANSIVHSFQELLDPELVNQIGEENFAQLTTIIESGFADLNLQKLEKVADQVEALAHQIRDQAEQYDGA